MFGTEDAGSDYIFGATVMSTFSEDTNHGTMAGITFQAVSEHQYYVFHTCQDHEHRRFECWQRTGPGWDDRREVWSTTAADDGQFVGQQLTMRVVCKGRLGFELWLNGDMLHSFSTAHGSQAYESGSVGLFAARTDATFERVSFASIDPFAMDSGWVLAADDGESERLESAPVFQLCGSCRYGTAHSGVLAMLTHTPSFVFCSMVGEPVNITIVPHASHCAADVLEEGMVLDGGAVFDSSATYYLVERAGQAGEMEERDSLAHTHADISRRMVNEESLWHEEPDARQAELPMYLRVDHHEGLTHRKAHRHCGDCAVRWRLVPSTSKPELFRLQVHWREHWQHLGITMEEVEKTKREHWCPWPQLLNMCIGRACCSGRTTNISGTSC
jgi:hypothetical protein